MQRKGPVSAATFSTRSCRTRRWWGAFFHRLFASRAVYQHITAIFLSLLSTPSIFKLLSIFVLALFSGTSFLLDLGATCEIYRNVTGQTLKLPHVESTEGASFPQIFGGFTTKNPPLTTTPSTSDITSFDNTTHTTERTHHTPTMASKIKDALPSHLRPSANGSDSERHHGKSQSHVVSEHLFLMLVWYGREEGRVGRSGSELRASSQQQKQQHARSPPCVDHDTYHETPTSPAAARRRCAGQRSMRGDHLLVWCITRLASTPGRRRRAPGFRQGCRKWLERASPFAT